jgi:hypothetical protein
VLGRGGLFSVVVSAVLAGRAAELRAQQPADASAPAPPVPAPPAPAAPAPDSQAQSQTQADAALRAAQELEARMVQIRRELDALERERASWDDIRQRLDDLDARTQGLARGQATGAGPAAGTGPGAGAAPPLLQFRNDGVVVRSPDGRFLLAPTVRLQGLYEGDIATRGPLDRSAPDASGFALTHAEVILNGHAVTRRLEYRLQVDFAAPQMLKDAFVQWRFAPALAVRVGQFKVPYGLQRQYWTGYLEMVNFSEATAAFSLERDVGLMVVGRPLAGRLHYQLAVLNGAGQGRTNDNLDLAYAVRVVAAPFGPLPLTEGDIDGQPRPRVSIGAAGYYNRLPTDAPARTGNPNAIVDANGDGRVDEVAVWQGGLELRAVWRGAALQGEWFGRIEQPPGGAGGAPSPDRRYWGAYGQASTFILPHRLEIVARIGRSDLPLYGAAAAVRAARGTAVDEQSGGVSAYLHGHQAKLQVDYSHLAAHDAGSAPEIHRIRAAVQLAF